VRAIYIGQTYRYSPEYSFYIFSQQTYLIIFLDFLSPSSFIPPQNVVYFIMLHFLVHKIFTFYINGVLNCKCPAPGPQGLNGTSIKVSKYGYFLNTLYQPITRDLHARFVAICTQIKFFTAHFKEQNLAKCHVTSLYTFIQIKSKLNL